LLQEKTELSDPLAGVTPWRVQIASNTSGSSDSLCEGVIIDETHILTSADCVHYSGELESVDLTSIHVVVSHVVPEIHAIKSVSISPENTSYRLVIITLDSRVTFTKSIQAVNLPPHEAFCNKLLGDNCALYANPCTTSVAFSDLQVARSVETTNEGGIQCAVITESTLRHSCAAQYPDIFADIQADEVTTCSKVKGRGVIAKLSRKEHQEVLENYVIGIVVGDVAEVEACSTPNDITYISMCPYLTWVNQAIAGNVDNAALNE
jgi:hypothetical protein